MINSMACHGLATKSTGFSRVWVQVLFMTLTVGDVLLSALPARLLMGDSQAYIHIDCTPVSAPGVGGNGPWKNS